LGSFLESRSNPNFWASTFTAKATHLIYEANAIGNGMDEFLQIHLVTLLKSKARWLSDTVASVHPQGCQIFLGTTYQNGKNIPK
jgi:hypothetical protein